MSNSNLSQVCIDIAEKWKAVRQDFWDLHHLQLRVCQGFRSYPEQAELYSRGRKKGASGQWFIFDKKKIVTYARAGESWHNYGLALDSCFYGGDPFLALYPKKECDFLWNEYGKLCEAHNLEWGGSWKTPDRPHAQKTYGLSLPQAQEIFEEQGLKGIWEKCSQIMACGKEIT